MTGLHVAVCLCACMHVCIRHVYVAAVQDSPRATAQNGVKCAVHKWVTFPRQGWRATPVSPAAPASSRLPDCTAAAVAAVWRWWLPSVLLLSRASCAISSSSFSHTHLACFLSLPSRTWLARQDFSTPSLPRLFPSSLNCSASTWPDVYP